LELLRKNSESFELISAHYEALQEDYQVELIQLFQVSIEEFARENTGRPNYYKLVQMLKVMSKVKGARPIIKSMVSTFQRRYPDRTAMHEILEKEFLRGR